MVNDRILLDPACHFITAFDCFKNEVKKSVERFVARIPIKLNSGIVTGLADKF
jgi:hypothetical protein